MDVQTKLKLCSTKPILFYLSVWWCVSFFNLLLLSPTKVPPNWFYYLKTNCPRKRKGKPKTIIVLLHEWREGWKITKRNIRRVLSILKKKRENRTIMYLFFWLLLLQACLSVHFSRCFSWLCNRLLTMTIFYPFFLDSKIWFNPTPGVWLILLKMPHSYWYFGKRLKTES